MKILIIIKPESTKDSLSCSSNYITSVCKTENVSDIETKPGHFLFDFYSQEVYHYSQYGWIYNGTTNIFFTELMGMNKTLTDGELEILSTLNDALYVKVDETFSFDKAPQEPTKARVKTIEDVTLTSDVISEQVYGMHVTKVQLKDQVKNWLYQWIKDSYIWILDHNARLAMDDIIVGLSNSHLDRIQVENSIRFLNLRINHCKGELVKLQELQKNGELLSTEVTVQMEDVKVSGEFLSDGKNPWDNIRYSEPTMTLMTTTLNQLQQALYNFNSEFVLR